MKIRSMVGLIPLFAVETLEPEVLDRHPGFKRRLEWFVENRPDLTNNVACMTTEGKGNRRLLSIADPDQLREILNTCWTRASFYLPTASARCRSFHREHPYVIHVNGMEHRVDYEPGESSTGLFGGNSNWRGPVWFPTNFLLVESLQKFHHYLGEDFKVEFPTGSGTMMTLWEVAGELSRRMTGIYSCATKKDADRCSAISRSSRPTRTGATSCSFTNTSTATRAPGSAPAIRPAGPAS